ncbi:restriction endonuclease [Phormidium sp. LEGE 05292]|uniref:restriction endonuclease n=1 Tax=[Phormidium] sp. LEGE 05292 TaxID=767427 RepID=UPI00187F0A98|nr:restriction endonuclease [Phormidium sp. LEGE 05292]MBE9225605.1 restriction endonuclease [Phormidium sp. LEGE 05292]
MTIIEAIKIVLQESKEPLNYKQIYKKIIEKNLYDVKAQNPEGVVNSQIRRHCLGLNFPSANPVKHFRVVDENKYLINDGISGSKKITKKEVELKQEELLPEEKVDIAYKLHISLVKQQLLDIILKADDAFFVRLVIDLLLRMGYGYDQTNSGEYTDGPYDEGIDAVIKQDELGLELIKVQAKKYALERKVDVKEVRAFAGALNKMKKGVFITTSDFTKPARDFAQDHEKTISLINGDLLGELMISHLVGVADIKTYRLVKIDLSYFSEIT